MPQQMWCRSVSGAVLHFADVAPLFANGTSRTARAERHEPNGSTAPSTLNVKGYYDLCDKFPLTTEEGLAGKTLQTNKPRFCRNISEPRDIGLMLLIHAKSEHTLKRCLPSFKFASGARLGDELRVVDLENSTGNKLSQIPKALEERRALGEVLVDDEDLQGCIQLMRRINSDCIQVRVPPLKSTA
ncbi:hypothetical protein Tco_0385168 [Tanacetum coccineum]